jgi:hypothetical protein
MSENNQLTQDGASTHFLCASLTINHNGVLMLSPLSSDQMMPRTIVLVLPFPPVLQVPEPTPYVLPSQKLSCQSCTHASRVESIYYTSQVTYNSSSTLGLRISVGRCASSQRRTDYHAMRHVQLLYETLSHGLHLDIHTSVMFHDPCTLVTFTGQHDNPNDGLAIPMPQTDMLLMMDVNY